MQVRKNGIYKTISSSDFGIYQAMGYEKVVAPVVAKKPEPVVEEKPVVVEEPVKVEEPIVEEPVVVEEEPIVEEQVEEPEVEEIVVPKSKKRKAQA